MKVSKFLKGLGKQLAVQTLGGRMRGRGCILCLHRVLPEEKKSVLSIPKDIEVSTQFLENFIEHFQTLGYRFIALGELAEFLKSSDPGPVMVLSFDDGYKDNLDYALPICERVGIPMAVYVTTGLLDRTVDPWWYSLQSLILNTDFIDTGDLGEKEGLVAGDLEEKEKAYQWIYRKIGEAGIGGLEVMEQIWQANGLNGAPDNGELLMNWDELRALRDSPLVTIGAHTVSHPRLIECECDDLQSEITESKARLQEELGFDIRHLAYPHGSEKDIPEGISPLVSDAGYETAVTTIPRNLESGDTDLLFTLPRKGVSDGFESLREMECGLTGVNILWNSRLRDRLKAVKGFK